MTRRGVPVAGIVPVGDIAVLARLRAAGPAGGLASVAGKFDDEPEFATSIDDIVRSRGRRPKPDLDE